MTDTGGDRFRIALDPSAARRKRRGTSVGVTGWVVISARLSGNKKRSVCPATIWNELRDSSLTRLVRG